MTFQEYCIQGEKADEFYKDEDFKSAEKLYLAIIDEIKNEKQVDIFIVSKVVLGLLLTYIKTKEINKAFDLWQIEPEKDITGLGIMGLGETYQVSVHDTMIYLIACAYLYSTSDEKPDDLAETVASYMKSVLNYTIEKEDKMTDLVISNWKIYLIKIFNGLIPEKYTDEISEFENKIGRIIPLNEIDFPLPSKWLIDWKTKEHIIGTDK